LISEGGKNADQKANQYPRLTVSAVRAWDLSASGGITTVEITRK